MICQKLIFVFHLCFDTLMFEFCNVLMDSDAGLQKDTVAQRNENTADKGVEESGTPRTETVKDNGKRNVRQF